MIGQALGDTGWSIRAFNSAGDQRVITDDSVVAMVCDIHFRRIGLLVMPCEAGEPIVECGLAAIERG